MGSETIFHIDVNSAYLSWSAIRRLQNGALSVSAPTVRNNRAHHAVWLILYIMLGLMSDIRIIKNILMIIGIRCNPLLLGGYMRSQDIGVCRRCQHADSGEYRRCTF